MDPITIDNVIAANFTYEEERQMLNDAVEEMIMEEQERTSQLKAFITKRQK